MTTQLLRSGMLQDDQLSKSTEGFTRGAGPREESASHSDNYAGDSSVLSEHVGWRSSDLLSDTPHPGGIRSSHASIVVPMAPVRRAAKSTRSCPAATSPQILSFSGVIDRLNLGSKWRLAVGIDSIKTSMLQYANYSELLLSGIALPNNVQKRKARPKRSIGRPGSDHELGLWVDYELLRKHQRKPSETVIHDPIIATNNRYLELADLVLSSGKPKKKSKNGARSD